MPHSRRQARPMQPRSTLKRACASASDGSSLLCRAVLTDPFFKEFDVNYTTDRAAALQPVTALRIAAPRVETAARADRGVAHRSRSTAMLPSGQFVPALEFDPECQRAW